MKPPCKTCERAGCGVYHDECVEYQKYVKWKKQWNTYRRNEIKKGEIIPKPTKVKSTR